jgi:hypothetical protein
VCHGQEERRRNNSEGDSQKNPQEIFASDNLAALDGLAHLGKDVISLLFRQDFMQCLAQHFLRQAVEVVMLGGVTVTKAVGFEKAKASCKMCLSNARPQKAFNEDCITTSPSKTRKTHKTVTMPVL